MGNETARRSKLRGIVFLFLWFILIISGIVNKRVYHHPDMMVLFHLPAAIFLVLAWRALSHRVREQYKRDIQKLER